MSTVPMSNMWEIFTLDGEDSKPADPATPTPTKPFKEAQHAAEDKFDSILREICQSKVDHQRQLEETFQMYSSDKTTQHRKFESRQPLFSMTSKPKCGRLSKH
jgi:hypothetical protein